MAARRTAWHLLFASLLTERAPPGFEVRAEVQLSLEPQRADILLLRRVNTPRRDDVASVLRDLWRYLASDTIVEFKSAARPLREGDVPRLLGYGAQYHASEAKRRLRAVDLTLGLAVASATPTLQDELECMGFSLSPLGNGYYRIEGNVYPSYLIVLDEVAEAERDSLLSAFGHRTFSTDADRRWWYEHLSHPSEGVMPQDLEGYEEAFQKMIESLPAAKRLAGLTAAERLAGLPPAERLTGLSPEQQVLALSDEVLRGFSETYIHTLPPDVQDTIRKRIGH